MKKLIFLTFVSTIVLAGENSPNTSPNASPNTSPTKSGYTRQKNDGAVKRERDNYFNSNPAAVRKKARKLFGAALLTEVRDK